MLRTRHVLTDTDITRQVTLQLPALDFYYVSEADSPIDREVAQAFCAEYQKIAHDPLSFDGIVRVDFYPSHRRLGALSSWDYGASRQYPHASYTEPICLVVQPNFIQLHTACKVQQRDGREALVVTDPGIAMYGKGIGVPDRQILPVPTLPATAASGYVMTYSGAAQEAVVYLDNGQAAITEYEGWIVA